MAFPQSRQAVVGSPAPDASGRLLRFRAGEPPPEPPPQYASLVTLAGTPITPQGEEGTDQLMDSGLGELGGHPVVQSIRAFSEAEAKLDEVTAVVPELLPMVQEFVLMMRTMLPRAAMMRMSGQMPGPGMNPMQGQAPGQGQGPGQGPGQMPGQQPGAGAGIPSAAMMPMLAGGAGMSGMPGA